MKSIKQFFIFTLFTVLTIVGKTQTYIPYDSCFYMTLTSIYCMNIVNDTLLVSGAGMDSAGGIYTNHVALWDGQHFHAMGLGNTNMQNLHDALYYEDTTFIVGGFNSMGNVPYTSNLAAWDGHNYYSIGQVVGVAETYSVAVWHDTLFFGGDGISVNGTVYNQSIFARHNGQFFSVGGLASKAWDLEVYNDKLYAAAWYYLYEYDPAINDFIIAADFNGYPEVMKVDTINNFLYVAGQFTGAATGSSVVFTDCVARWNGFYWENIGTGDNGICGIYGLELYRGDVYIGGSNVDTLSNTYVGDLARWDGQQWHMVGPYPGVRNSTIFKIKAYKDTLYVGLYSYNSTIGTDTINGLIRFYMPPDTTCKYLMPRVFTENNEDTFYLSNGQVEVQFYNNNAYVQTWDWDFDNGGTDTIKDPLHTFTDTGTYNVCVTVNDTGCIKTACKTITVLNPTTIPTIDIKYEELKLYPNPTNGNFFVDINLPEIEKQTEIRIFSSQGILKAKYRLQQGRNHVEIPSANWTAGNYLVCLVAGNKLVKSKKLVLTK